MDASNASGRRLLVQAVLFTALCLAASRLDRIAAAGIGFYQTSLSKRFSHPCRTGQVTGGESCSAYAKRVIGEEGFVRGLSMSVARFHACGLMGEKAAKVVKGENRIGARL